MRLRKPRSFGNPGAFNYERHLRLQGIRVRGFVNEPGKIVSDPRGTGQSGNTGHGAVPDPDPRPIRSQAPFPEGTLIQAMTLGEQSEIPRDIQDRFNRTGTSHIIAISGFNVGIIALITFFLIRTLLKTSEYLLLRYNIQKLSALFAFAPVVFYGFVAGLGMSTVRALLMTLALLVTILMGRGRDLLNTLALAAFAILVLSPAALFDISFQLSFMAVASILLFMPGITERLTAWKNGAETRIARLGRKITADVSLFVAVSAACTLGTLPFIVYYFNRISNITLVANLVLVPILGFVVLPFSMLLILVAPLSESLSALLIDITTVLTRLCLDINDWLAALPGSSSIVTTPTIPELVAYYVILIAAALLMGLPGRTTWETHIFWTRQKLAVSDGTGRCVSRRRYGMAPPETAEPRDTARNLPQRGSRQCHAGRIPRRDRMLVDGGGSYDDRFDVGHYVVAPFLWHERIGKIDTVVLTHPHPDHVNGLPYILDNFDVKEVWSNGDEAVVQWGAAFADKIRQKGIAHRLLTSKSSPIDIGGVRVSILNPGKGPPADTDLSDREINERALVMQLRWGEAVFLLPSDIGEPTERVLVDRYRTLASGVLLAPHHGSAYSSSQPFLRAVRPETIVISTGRPVREDVLERFRKTGAALYRTDVHGAIRITTDGRRYEVVPLKSP